MFKKLGVLAIVIGSCTSVLAVGCSSSSDTNGGGSSDEDSGSGSKKDGGGGSDGGLGGEDGGLTGKDGGTGTKDSGTEPPSDGGVKTTSDGGGPKLPPADAGADAGLGDAGVPACYVLADVGVDTDSTAPAAHQNVCSTAQVTAHDTACVATGATNTTCQAWAETAANNNCAICIYGASGGGTPSPAYIQELSDGSGYINVGGCYAALSTATATCKTSFAQYEACLDGACYSCTTDYGTCVDDAVADTAGTSCAAQFPLGSTCPTPLQASIDAPANQTACGASATTVEQQFNTVITTLCGAP